MKTKKRKYVALLLCFILAFGMPIGSNKSVKSAKAASNYVIKVNKTANCVTVYKNVNGKYKPVKALICSTGYATKLGTYSLGQKMRWHTLDGPCYGQYCTRIYGGVLFHSVWYTGYNNPSTLSTSAYNKLGTIASHGCVRLTVAGAKWIYDNVPSGSKVIIYSSSNPGPLGKPAAIKLPVSVRWDPTDTTNPNNPWNNKKPKITGAKNVTLAYGVKYSVKKNIKAVNTTGFDATSLLKVSITYNGKKVSKVNTKVPGKYKVTYSIKDQIGRKATKKITVTIKPVMKKIVLTGVKDLYVTSKSKLTRSYMLKNIVAKQNGDVISNKYVKVSLKKIRKNVYQITYTAENGSVPTVKKAKAYVDTVAPSIMGIKNNTNYRIEKSDKVTAAYARNMIKLVSDDITKVSISQVKIAVTKLDSGKKYKVVYSLKDQAGNVKKVTIYLIPTEFVKITVPTAITVSQSAIGCSQTSTDTEEKEALKTYLTSKYTNAAKTYDNKTAKLNVVPVLKSKKEFETVYTVSFVASDAQKHMAKKTVEVIVKKEE